MRNQNFVTDDPMIINIYFWLCCTFSKN